VIFHANHLALHMSALTLILGIAGCSSSDSSPPAGNSSSGGTSSSGGGTKVVSFKTDVVPILQASCSTGGTLCHGDPSVVTMGTVSGGNRDYLGPSSGAFTPATTTMVLGAMVGKPSLEDPSMNVVTVGDPTKSYLIYKIDGTQGTLSAQCMTGELAGCGLLMPYGTTVPLPQATLDTIKNWVTQGALNN
jgi:hypothetical protein